MSWKAIFELGAVVDVQVTYWTGTEGVEPGDLGVELTDEVKRLLRFGARRMLPSASFRDFKRVENTVYRALASNSRRCPIGRWYVPNARLPVVAKTMRHLQEVDYPEALADFEARYDKIRGDMPAHFASFVDTIWPMLPNPPRSKESYLAELLHRADTAYPSIEDLRPRFRFEYMAIKFDEVALAGQSSRAGDFALAAINEARAEVREATGKVLAIVRSDGAIRGMTITALDRALQNFVDLDFLGDQSVLRAIEKARALFLARDAEEFRTSSAARGELEVVLADLGQIASPLDRLSNTSLIWWP